VTKELVVIALGGNALIRRGEEGTFDQQLSNLTRIASHLASLSEKYSLIVTHGNGPQVGNLYLQQESTPDVPPMPLHACGAMTQSLIGYMIQQALSTVKPDLRVAVVTTRVEVDPNDPAFTSPTKPVGPFYPESRLEELRRRGWSLVHVPGKGWRRVVPSPLPRRILELEVIRSLIGNSDIIVAVGGGGIPVIRSDKGYVGVDAVIDKDMASSLLAAELDASRLVILTDVEGAYLDYGKPTQKLLPEICAKDALRMANEEVFPKGSMGPKVEAASLFSLRTGRISVISHLDRILEAVEYGAGTRILPC
jgi:carbamate kinase